MLVCAALSLMSCTENAMHVQRQVVVGGYKPSIEERWKGLLEDVHCTT